MVVTSLVLLLLASSSHAVQASKCATSLAALPSPLHAAGAERERLQRHEGDEQHVRQVLWSVTAAIGPLLP